MMILLIWLPGSRRLHAGLEHQILRVSPRKKHCGQQGRTLSITPCNCAELRMHAQEVGSVLLQENWNGLRGPTWSAPLRLTGQFIGHSREKAVGVSGMTHTSSGTGGSRCPGPDLPIQVGGHPLSRSVVSMIRERLEIRTNHRHSIDIQSLAR